MYTRAIKFLKNLEEDRETRPSLLFIKRIVEEKVSKDSAWNLVI